MINLNADCSFFVRIREEVMDRNEEKMKYNSNIVMVSFTDSSKERLNKILQEVIKTITKIHDTWTVDMHNKSGTEQRTRD